MRWGESAFARPTPHGGETSWSWNYTSMLCCGSMNVNRIVTARIYCWYIKLSSDSNVRMMCAGFQHYNINVYLVLLYIIIYYRGYYSPARKNMFHIPIPLSYPISAIPHPPMPQSSWAWRTSSTCMCRIPSCPPPPSWELVTAVGCRAASQSPRAQVGYLLRSGRLTQETSNFPRSTAHPPILHHSALQWSELIKGSNPTQAET